MEKDIAQLAREYYMFYQSWKNSEPDSPNRIHYDAMLAGINTAVKHLGEYQNFRQELRNQGIDL